MHPLMICSFRNRKGAAGGKGHAHGTIRKVSNESKAVPAPDANAELPASIQVTHQCQVHI